MQGTEMTQHFPFINKLGVNKMAHGTGLYWNRINKLDIKKDEYMVIFYQLFDYYYPQMSDCYEPSCEAKNEYKVEVLKYREIKGRMYADHLSEKAETETIGKEEAKKIYWNLKNRNISFKEVKKYFEEIKNCL